MEIKTINFVAIKRRIQRVRKTNQILVSADEQDSKFKANSE